MMPEEMLIDSDDNFPSDADDSDFEMESLSARIQKKKPGSKMTAKKVPTKKAPPTKQNSNKDIEMENLEPKKLNSKAPSKKKVGTTSKKPSVKKQPLAEESSNKEEAEEDDFMAGNTFSSNAKVLDDKKTVEERYQKKTQLEHILLRPDTYSKF
jgi:hypothetical protein